MINLTSGSLMEATGEIPFKRTAVSSIHHGATVQARRAPYAILSVPAAMLLARVRLNRSNLAQDPLSCADQRLYSPALGFRRLAVKPVFQRIAVPLWRA